MKLGEAMQITGAVALVTGANGGLGKYYVEALQSQGVAKIYAGARNPDPLADLVAADPSRIIVIPLYHG
jgi:NAD(P)-dependent dehydrogenase (short-subunit alcohol dehydrogenase family)